MSEPSLTQIEKRLTKLERTQDIHGEHIGTLVRAQQTVETKLKDFIASSLEANAAMIKSVEAAHKVIDALAESHRSFAKVVVHGKRA